MAKKVIPPIHASIQEENGSVAWTWYLFFQWIADNAGGADLSNYFTKEETEALLELKANTADLATVATSGSYNDLSNKPTIPTVNNATLTITQGGVSKGTFTANASTDVTIALDSGGSGTDLPDQTGHSGEFLTTNGTSASWGAAPVTSVNSKTGAVTLTASDVGALPDSTVIPAAQVNSDWNAVSGVAEILNKPTIPTVNDSTITITQGGVTKGSFTLNQSSGDTIALDAGEIEWATYGTTTYQQVSDWASAGKEVLCVRDNVTYRLAQTSASFHIFTSATGAGVMSVYVSNADTWFVGVTQYEPVFRSSVMPTAGLAYNNKIYQYTGTTDANYTNGYFYKCVSDGGVPATYSWVQTDVQPAGGGSLPSQTGNAGKFLTTDGTSASWDTLATVAKSGSYNDLTNKPIIPAAQVNSDWNAASGVAEILNKPTLATVATSGSYNDLTNKPTIPTVGNGTITITQGGTTKGTFTTNQGGNTTIDLDAGSTGGYHPGLFAHEWDDHLRNDVQWLRADTFSWQDGSAYEAAYNHLVDDIGETQVSMYAWKRNSTYFYTESATPLANDPVYNANGELQAEVEVNSDGTTIQVDSLLFSRDSSADTTMTIIDATKSTETIAGTTITFYLATDGHKICLATQESNVAAIYAATGVAWYYIVDTANTRFKLPRTQYNEVGLRDTVGKYVPESLPNITAIISGTVSSGSSSGAAQDGSTYAGNWNYGTGSLKYVEIDASRASSAYQNDAPVQQRATQMYLYFYVGSFTQTALENTAGLNAGLFNGKADIDLSNTPMATADYVVEWQAPAAGNNYTWYRKYKSGWVEQGGQFAQSGDGVAITLPVTMANANYSVVGGTLDNSGAQGWRYANRTTTGFTKNLVGSTQCGGSWEVRGTAA